jgi:hypothetical protein
MYLIQTAQAFCAEAMRGGTAQAMEGCISGVHAAIMDRLTPFVPQAHSSTTRIDTADAASASDEVRISLLDTHNSLLHSLSFPLVQYYSRSHHCMCLSALLYGVMPIDVLFSLVIDVITNITG